MSSVVGAAGANVSFGVAASKTWMLRVSVPVTQLAKWKTVLQNVAIGFLIAGEAGDHFIAYVIGNGADMVVSHIGITLLWLAALLTLYTGYDYFRAGLRHLIEE